MKLKMLNLLLLFMAASLLSASKQVTPCCKSTCTSEAVYNDNGSSVLLEAEAMLPPSPGNFLFIY
jgi:hypothetical protein